jgi:hypothetical protein
MVLQRADVPDAITCFFCTHANHSQSRVLIFTVKKKMVPLFGTLLETKPCTIQQKSVCTIGGTGVQEGKKKFQCKPKKQNWNDFDTDKVKSIDLQKTGAGQESL